MTSLQTPAPSPGSLGRVDLVMEGGGVKGIALAGALEVLEERGYTVNRVAGSSAGSIAGMLSTAGIPATTIVDILRATDYRKFEDGPWWTRTILGKAAAILLHNGIHRGEHLMSWLEEQLDTYAAPGRTGTFDDLLHQDPDPQHRAEGPRAFRLVVTASDLSAGRLRHLPTDAQEFGTTPGQLRVVETVRASTSIPLFFRPVRWRNAQGRPAVLVDGGLLSNFPVSVFDRPDDEMPRWPTFGIKLSATPEADFGVTNRIRGPLSFGKAVVDTVTGFYDRMHIDSSHAVARTIFIDTAAVRPTQFDLSEEDRELLYRKGRTAATSFLDGDDEQAAWDFEVYKARFRTSTARGQ
ncbi:patatin-like phospholipase family protein [Brachybacterium sp. AOP35-5H-19]|uniref:patatin-like phospholipase family protein n=1 Tax=Brachybacterium sp. AOP35-5H-19 TaxID=3457685 RepID=UPI0040335620